MPERMPRRLGHGHWGATQRFWACRKCWVALRLTQPTETAGRTVSLQAEHARGARPSDHHRARRRVLMRVVATALLTTMGIPGGLAQSSRAQTTSAPIIAVASDLQFALTDVAEAFPSAEAVNHALRLLLDLARSEAAPAKRTAHKKQRANTGLQRTAPSRRR